MDQRDAIARVLITQKFAAGDNIVNEGDPASSFYIIKDVSFKKFNINKKYNSNKFTRELFQS